MATLIQTIAQIQQLCGSLRSERKRIGLVPTMGSLHDGHLSLILKAKEHADAVITSVFVNPTQFGPGEDFERYPRDLDRDCSMAFAAGSDMVFAPSTAEMYPDGFQASVDVGAIGEVLEGKSRPGHFKGVATVVTKLFHLTQPHVAVFGSKDAQQLAVLQAMVRDLNFDVEIIAAPIVREADGLALSSRNVYLSAEQRLEAVAIYRSLRLAEERVGEGVRDARSIIKEMSALIQERSSGVIDYISLANQDTLEEYTVLTGGDRILVSLAVRFGKTRLIDNCSIRVADR